MQIKINTKTEIMWIVVALYLLKRYVIEVEMFFLLMAGVLAIYTLRKQAISIPKIPGLWIYVALLGFMCVLGTINHPISLVERDAFYEFYPVLYLFFGYYIFDYYRNHDKSIWKTVCLCLFISTVVCLIRGVAEVSVGANFGMFRDAFSAEVQNISVIAPILMCRTFLYKEETFSKSKDLFLCLAWGAQMLLNLSRVAIVNVFAGIIIMFLCGTISGKIKTKNYFRVFVMVAVLVAMGGLIFSVMPKDATDRLAEKIENTFTEINAKKTYGTSGDAQTDWRGYEIQCAQNQWSKYSTMEQIFGKGNGTLISIHYVPEAWKDTVEIQNQKLGVTILHNTYYTYLIKGGVLSILILLYFIGANLIRGVRRIKSQDKETIFWGIVLIAISLAILTNAYVVRTMISKGSEMMIIILVGWINARLNEPRNIGKTEVEMREV
ncbi:MAG: O-antigen ligase family protein [Eubacterium sp.]|nr:O-antigen ligase family protein [Eubacterium sp.]